MEILFLVIARGAAIAISPIAMLAATISAVVVVAIMVAIIKMSVTMVALRATAVFMPMITVPRIPAISDNSLIAATTIISIMGLVVAVL